MARAGRYRAVPYRSLPHPAGDPDRLAVVARLHGLTSADPDSARVVELGCGDGGNLLAVAAARPRAELLGFDVERSAVERGTRLGAAAGLDQVRLRAADLRDLRAEDVGAADYVVIHGLWSWVGDDVREAVLALAAGVVAEHGVVCVSYNALPGWHLWMAPRAIARRAAAGEEDPDRAASLAMDALREAADLHGRDDAYGRMLAAAAERLAGRPSELVFHDDLADECTAFSVVDVARRAESHGLRYLGEAMPEHWWAARVARRLAGQIRDAGPAPLDRQQAADLASGVDFKATLFVPATAAPAAEPDPAAALDLAIGARHDGPALPDGTAEPVRALLDAVSDALFKDVRDAAAAAGLNDATAAGAALRLVADGHARFAMSPPPAAADPGERPRAPALARLQADEDARVATLLHGTVTLDDPGVRALLKLLDGSLERADLPDALRRTAEEQGFALDTDGLEAAVEGTLERFAQLGLLAATNAPAPTGTAAPGPPRPG